LATKVEDIKAEVLAEDEAPAATVSVPGTQQYIAGPMAAAGTPAPLASPRASDIKAMQHFKTK
jgi:hypothetical protein